MKRFRFALQPVAALRAHRELRVREAFAAAAQELAKSERDLALVRERVAHFERALAAGRQGRFLPAAEAQALAAYRVERTAENDAERVVLAARTTLNQRRAEYLEAHRKLEVVKRLEEKARRAHRLETGREEQAEFDDFASRRVARRSLFSA